MISRRALGVYGGVVLLSFTAAVSASKKGYLPAISITVGWLRASGAYVPGGTAKKRSELVLIFIGSPTGRAANTSELPSLVEHAKLLLWKQAQVDSMDFAAIGIAKTISPDEGLKYLKRFGAFDEVMAGRGWYNEGVLKYIYGQHRGAAATPQLIVIERSTNDADAAVDSERELTRRIGIRHITAWVHAGAPVSLR